MPSRAADRTRSQRRRSKPWKRRLKIAFALFAILVFGLVAVGSYVSNGYLRDAEAQLAKVDETIQQSMREPSRVLAAGGQVLFRVTTEYRDPVGRLEDVPLVVRQAILAAEDRRFYNHPGVDFRAIVRSLVTNVREERLAQGASTITMQVARLITGRYQKTWDRKLKEAALAYQLDRSLTKDQILLHYLNLAYFGSGAYGVKAAAHVYFNKNLDELTLAEAAMLARCVRRPSRENPFDNLEASIRNRDTVLSIMREEGMIDEAQYRKALAEKPRLRPRNFAGGARILAAPYFVNYVIARLKAKRPDLDLWSGGYTVWTTLDLDLQRIAEREVRRVVEANRRRKVTTGAFLLLDSKGRMLAMVGGADYSRNQYNVITQGKRQPGSSFKPFVYAAALDSGALSPDDRVSNARYVWQDPVTGKVWAPENSGGSYGGMVSLRSALARSLNVVAVRVMEKAGAETVVDYAHRVFGFESNLDPVLSLALGSSAVSPLEMARGYSVFQHRGNRVEPFGIVRVTDATGAEVYVEQPQLTESGLKPAVAEEIDSYLREVVERGTAAGYRSQMPPNSRGKTGTTQENRDAWFCGYTDRFLGIGWVGNEQYDETQRRWRYLPMGSRVFGGTVTVQIWARVVSEAVRRYGDVPPADGSSVPAPVEVSVDETEAPPLDEDAGVGASEGTEPPVEIEAPVDAPTTPQPETNPPLPAVETPATAQAPPDVEPMVSGEVGPRRLAEQDRLRGGAETRPKVAQPKATKPQETEPVEICADTGLRATIYCPETITRKFPKGKAPKGECKRHVPPSF